MVALVSGSMLGSLALVIAAFAAMEPITAATHRWVMHGLGQFLHRSHHRQITARVEANDAYPVMFAAVVCVGLWAGFNLPGLDGVIPVGIGVTLYGIAYAVVHDVYIHGRIGLFGHRRIAVMDRLAEAHRIHHLYNGAPYGMLFPVVPKRLRERAAGTDRNPLDQRTGRERVATVPGP